MEAAAAAAAPPSSVVNNEEEKEYELASSAVDEMPAGFRFHPTDLEIIIHYLLNKVIDPRFRSVAIGEIDLNKCEPWDLPQKARKMGEKEWFFFFEKETKYPTGKRTNRATASGYWKATGKDREIYNKGKIGKNIVGMKKTLVFYKGRAPKGDKTNWVIHEYRLQGEFFSAYNLSNHAKEKWVVCRVSHKKDATNEGVEISRIDSSLVDHYLVDSPTPTQLPPLTDYSSLTRKPSSTSATQETDQSNTLQEFQQQCHQNSFFLPRLEINNHNQYYSSSAPNNPNYSTQMDRMNSILPYESTSLAYQYQDGLSSSTMEWYLTNFPIKEDDDDKPNSRILAPDNIYVGGKEPERMCKMEAISFNNSVMSSPSQDTGFSTEMAAAAEINCEKEREGNKQDDAVTEGLCFSPNISDLDSLWSY